MNKVFPIAIGVVAIIFLALMLPGVLDGTESFRTDVKTQEFTVATGAGETADNVTLTWELWQNAVTEVTTLSSDDTTDNPVASTYTAAGNLLEVTGLAASENRTLTVSYRTAGLDRYAGADTAATKLPTIVVGLVILIPLALMAVLFMHR